MATDTEEHVCISTGNTKMGDIKSVSLPLIKTCIVCACNFLCYMIKLLNHRSNVYESYERNLRILQNNPEQYWREVEAAIMTVRFFRFHVCGDIYDADYFDHMVEIAKRNGHCQILCFTKKFDIVNDYVNANGIESIPSNLHLLFSGWRGLEMKNPYNFPEAHVRFKDGYCEAKEGAIECNGNCTECATTDSGCWSLVYGEQLILDEH